MAAFNPHPHSMLELRDGIQSADKSVVDRLTAYIVGALLCVCLLLPGVAAASGRHRSQARPSAPSRLLLPGATAPAAMSAPILSGLDYSAVAPPGVKLRLIEDEPYIHTTGSASGRLALGESLTSFTLHAETLALDNIPVGSYEARISFRLAGSEGKNMALAQSFDNAAHSAYRHALLGSEQRGEVVYRIDEIRSPLGLTDGRDCIYAWREYLAYSAVAINPDSAEGAARLTPYQYLRGELRVLRMIGRREGLLCIEMEAQEFPQALTLTENIARCVINRLLAGAMATPLSYLAYYPEGERAQLTEFEVLDPRTADLAEQPGTGCGVNPILPQGDLCPDCAGTGPFWPAQPYKDNLYISLLARDVGQAICSHCLLSSVPSRADRKDKLPASATGEPTTMQCADWLD